MATPFESFMLSVVGGATTGIVGMVFYHLNDRFSNKKTVIYGSLDEVENLIRECVEKSSAVWVKRGAPERETGEIIALLHDINQLISFINFRETNTKLRTSSAVLNLRRAVSGDNFDVKNRKPNPARVQEIRSAAMTLRIVLKEIKLERRPFLIF